MFAHRRVGVAVAVGDRRRQRDQVRRASCAAERRLVGIGRIVVHHSPHLVERHSAGIGVHA